MIGLRVDAPHADRSLRIAHVIDGPFSARAADGVPQVVHSLARAQADLGQPVAVFSTVNGAHVLGDLSRSHAGLKPCATSDGRQPCGHWLDERVVSRFLDRRLAEDVLAWRPDLLHFHSVHIPQNVALAAQLRGAGIPYCVTVHGGLFPQALRRGRLKKAVFHRLFERRYLNGARFVHAVSPREASAIRRYGVTCPVVVVPNGLPPDLIVPPSQPDALYRTNPSLRGRQVFMFIGRLDPWHKGLDLLIDAFARARLRDAALVLVGPDWRGSRRWLARRADRHGVLPQVVFTGPAFGEDRANLVAAADVFVHPSRWEGLSLSVLAAAASGKACLITRDADPLGELERAGAAMLVDATVPSLAAGLTRSAALTVREREVMGARARRVAEGQATWPAIAAGLMAAYGSAGGGDEQRPG